MKCLICATKLTDAANFCSICGVEVREKNVSELEHSDTPSHLGNPSGFGRTLSTELLTSQEKSNTLLKIRYLMDCYEYSPGEIIIRKGDLNRDLYFLTKGQVVATTSEQDDDVVLNEITSPHIFGDMGSILGMPRTATVKTKTQATVYILSYKKLVETMGEFPDWFVPLLRSFVSGITSLNNTINKLEQDVQQLRGQLSDNKKA